VTPLKRTPYYRLYIGYYTSYFVDFVQWGIPGYETIFRNMPGLLQTSLGIRRTKLPIRIRPRAPHKIIGGGKEKGRYRNNASGLE